MVLGSIERVLLGHEKLSPRWFFFKKIFDTLISANFLVSLRKTIFSLRDLKF